MNLDNIPQRELIEIFKEVIEQQEEKVKRFTEQFHNDIFMDLAIVKLKLDSYVQKNLVQNLTFEKELDLIDSALHKLTTSFREIHPSMPQLVGIAKALEFHTKEFTPSLPLILTFENRIEKETETLFSHQELISISKLYTAILNHFIFQPGAVLNVIIYSTDKGLWFDFKKDGDGAISNDLDDYFDFLSSNFKEIKARLLMVNAEIQSNANWNKELRLLIPANYKKT